MPPVNQPDPEDRQLSAAEVDELLGIVFRAVPPEAQKEGREAFAAIVWWIHRDHGVRPPFWVFDLMGPAEIEELVDMLFTGIPEEKRGAARQRFLNTAAEMFDGYGVERPEWLKLALSPPP